MHKASYTLPPPPVHTRERGARFLKLLPIAALLAAGFAPNAYATTCGTETYSGSGHCEGNSSNPPAVTIDGDVNARVYGKYVSFAPGEITCNATTNEAIANDATVTMTAGTVTLEVYGGNVTDGSDFCNGFNRANANKVTISGGTLEKWVTGGHVSDGGDADDNEVLIEGSSTLVKGDVTGGFVNKKGSASNNTVTISGASVGGGTDAVTGARVNAGETKNNTVTIKDGAKASGMVVGAYAKSAWPSENTVSISGDSTVITGDVRGGWSSQGATMKNTVSISGGTVKGSVYGGYLTVSSSEATGNTVTLAGGTVEGGVYGGHAEDGNGDHVTGNTLNVQGKNLKVGGVANFALLDFTLPDGFNAASDVALNITGTEAVNLDGVTINVGGSIPTLAAGESLTLISKTTGAPVEITGLPAGYEYEVRGSELIIKAPASGGGSGGGAGGGAGSGAGGGTGTGGGDSSSPTMGELGLLLSGLALAGAAAPALRRRERKARKQD